MWGRWPEDSDPSFRLTWVEAAAHTSAPPKFLPMTADEYELRFEIPPKLVYELSRFGNSRPVVVGGGPGCRTIDQDARIQCRRLVNRITELQHRIRRAAILDRWYLRTPARLPVARRELAPFTAMTMDEAIIGGRIVDQGA